MEKLTNKKWEIKEKAPIELLDEIASHTKTNRVVSQILINRGCNTPSKALDFINKSNEILHDPFLLNDMDNGVKRILNAIKDNEKITIYGDYDVDGITSVSILYSYLENIGANVEYYIPHRQTEGYGVSKEAIKKIATDGTKLIITVDTGITAYDEVDEAKNLGIDFVITDHHECTDVLPNAIAVVNPKRHDTTYPFSGLAGVGVVFKLLCAIEYVRSQEPLVDSVRKIAYKYSDLVSIGTISDVMPLIDENRIIVSLGLKCIENTQNIGLRTLVELCQNNDSKSSKQKIKRISSSFIGFTLAPKINAAGRISNASIAVELFLSRDEQSAKKYSLELYDINKERQLEENKIAEEAFEKAEAINSDNTKIIVLESNTWTNGIIGIVSSRVTEKYALPSILISFEGNEDPYSPEALGKGSGRSIKGMNLVEALAPCDDILEKHGGHELAAGLSIRRKNLDEFKRRINEYAVKCFAEKNIEPIITIDYELSLDEVTVPLIKSIELLEPYGVANATPYFVLREMLIDDISPVGMNRHLRITLSKNGTSIIAMLFSCSLEDFAYSINDEIDVCATLEINDFMGNQQPRLNIKDIHPSSRLQALVEEYEKQYNKANNGDCTLTYYDIVPSREECGVVYKVLLNSAKEGRNTYTVIKLMQEIERAYSCRNIGYVKLKFIIKIFEEMNIFIINELSKTEFEYKCIPTKTKINLENSNILKKLKQLYSND